MPDFELDTLLNDLGFTGDERTQAVALLTPKADKLKSRVMAQADYSRSKDALSKEQLRVKQLEESVNADFARIAEYEASLGRVLGVSDVNQVAPRLTAMISEHTEATARAAALEAELRKQAADYGFTPTIPAAGSGGGAPPPKARQPDIDTSRFLTTDTLNKELEGYPLLPAALHDLGVQHQKLFGAPLENVSELVQLSIASAREAQKFKDPSLQKSVQQVWAEKHNVEAKRLEIAKAAEDARVEQRAQELVIQKMSQQKTGGAPNTGIPGSPILNHEFKPAAPDGKVPTVQVGNERRGVDAALSKFGNYYGGQSQ